MNYENLINSLRDIKSFGNSKNNCMNSRDSL